MGTVHFNHPPLVSWVVTHIDIPFIVLARNHIFDFCKSSGYLQLVNCFILWRMLSTWTPDEAGCSVRQTVMTVTESGFENCFTVANQIQEEVSCIFHESDGATGQHTLLIQKNLVFLKLAVKDQSSHFLKVLMLKNWQTLLVLNFYRTVMLLELKKKKRIILLFHVSLSLFFSYLHFYGK